MKVAQTLCRRARVAVAHRLVQTLLLTKPFVQLFLAFVVKIKIRKFHKAKLNMLKGDLSPEVLKYFSLIPA